MKLPRISLASIGFAIFVVAIDFSLIRAGLTSNGKSRSAILLMLLMPMLDVLLVCLFRLRRRDRRTAGSIGFLVAGSAACAAFFVSNLVASESVFLTLAQVGRPIAMFCITGATRVFGNGFTQTMTGQIILGLGFELLLPAALICTPPLAVAYAGRWLGRRFGQARPVDGRPIGLMSAA